MRRNAQVCARESGHLHHLTCLLLLLSLGFLLPRSGMAQDVPATQAADEAIPPPAPVALLTQRQPAPRDISWKSLFPDTLRDQRDIWLFPYSAARGHHYKPVLAVAAITAVLIASDAPSARYFRGAHAYRGFNHAFSGNNTWLATESAPAALYLAGLLRSDKYAQRTALLSAEAFLDAQIVSLVMEDTTHRLLPSDVRPGGNMADTWFDHRGHYLTGGGGFPSGHTISVFAIATIIADRYPNPAWHRWLAYGAASAVGFSRLSGQSHFNSDVFVGAILGYSIAHYVVLRARHPSENRAQ